MIDLNATNEVLTSVLLNATITDITSANMAFDNVGFDPSGMSAWIDVSYMPADFSTTSKTTTGQQEVGIFQVSINVPQGDTINDVKQYASRQNQMVSDVLNAFATNTQAVYNGVTVSILDSGVQPARKSGGWYVRDISINYIRIGA